MNTAINDSNQSVENAVQEGQYTNRNRPAAVKEVSAKEFWTFWGLMLYSCVVDAKGNLWQTSEEHYELQSPKVNMMSYIAKHRFGKMKGSFLLWQQTWQGRAVILGGSCLNG